MCIRAHRVYSGWAWFWFVLCRHNENSQLGRECSGHFHPAEQGGGRRGIKCGACVWSERRKISSDGCQIFAWLLRHAVARKLDDKGLESYLCLHYFVMLGCRRKCWIGMHHFCILPNVKHVKICALMQYPFGIKVGRKIFGMSWSMKLSDGRYEGMFSWNMWEYIGKNFSIDAIDMVDWEEIGRQNSSWHVLRIEWELQYVNTTRDGK